jgi:uncharacterized protein (TIGR01777 family)
MLVAATGVTGFVGSSLVPQLLARGHQVRVLTRAKPAAGALAAGAEARVVDTSDAVALTGALEGAEGVVNLAGAGVFDKRWSKAYKREILASRVVTTRALVDAMGRLAKRPSVFLSGSAVGHYGPRKPGEAVDETTARTAEHAPADVLAHVCWEWERAAAPAEVLGVRTAFLRIGVVLGRGGGAMAKMLTPFRFGVGGPIGRGRQDMSWIHIDDVCGLIAFALETPEVRGPFNLTAPNPVSNKEFARALGRALGKPAFLPTPGLALRLGLGQVASMLTTGQRVLPTKALSLGYRFRFPHIDPALADLVATPTSAGAA